MMHKHLQGRDQLEARGELEGGCDMIYCFVTTRKVPERSMGCGRAGGRGGGRCLGRCSQERGHGLGRRWSEGATVGRLS